MGKKGEEGGRREKKKGRGGREEKRKGEEIGSIWDFISYFHVLFAIKTAMDFEQTLPGFEPERPERLQ